MLNFPQIPVLDELKANLCPDIDAYLEIFSHVAGMRQLGVYMRGNFRNYALTT